MRLSKCKNRGKLTSVFYRAKEGHPTQFLKVLHYALFCSSRSVRDHLFANGVDKNVVHLNDLDFLKSCLYTLVNMFDYRANLTEDQFFKYGYAEVKMLLCCDAICLVKQMEKQLRMQRSLSAKRAVKTKRMTRGGYT